MTRTRTELRAFEAIARTPNVTAEMADTILRAFGVSDERIRELRGKNDPPPPSPELKRSSP